MKRTFQAVLAALVLLGGMSIVAVAQDSSGTVNTLSVNPRQNQELTNTTGTETGQPSDVVPGSENQPNGLVPVTTTMQGSGSNGNMPQAAPAKKAPAASAPTAARPQESNKTPEQKSGARPKK
jgi:hypothetical protein